MKVLSFAHPLLLRLRKPLGIGTLLSLLLSGSLVLTLSLVGGYSVRTIFESKYQDVIGLLAADAERYGSLIQNNLDASLHFKGMGSERRAPDAVLKVFADGQLETVSGGLGDGLRLKNFRINAQELDQKERPLAAFQLSGETWVADLTHDVLKLWRVPVAVVKADGRRFFNQGTTLYLTTREGRLIYSNDDAISAENFSKRALVKSFLESPLTRGYTSIEEKGQDAILGAFFEIPRSNMILFVETRKEYVLASLTRTVQQGLMIFTFIMLTTLVLLQFPLRRIVRPIQELVDQAEAVAKGDFHRPRPKKASGEIKRLADAFDQMCESLESRDIQIQGLARKEIERAQLHNELVVAQNIQNNLLPQKSRIVTPGLTVDALYRPASLCAGDWYFTKHDADSDSTLFVIADVSGHGVGSSMFTAIIAGLFNMYVKRPRGSWDLEDFTREVNSALFDLGKTQWHVSLIVGLYEGHRSQIDLVFCGHVPPYLSSWKEGVLVHRFVHAPSDVLGLSEYASVKKSSIAFVKGSSLLLYTDGLTEAKNAAGKAWGNKRLAKCLQALRQDSADPSIHDLMHVWDEFRENVDPEDDVCVISLAAS
ncbi:MAG: SpoIIE family protein phosphatase [Oligoflexus sp.]|nr:SpoIIE family protein phosphatase [Oligoflexus sp.]